MRHLFIPVFALLLSILLPGCNRQRSAARQAMAHAELLMDSLPDSALAIMRSIALPADANGEDRALHALLMSQALDKNYIDVSDDSLISVAGTYYRTTSDLRRRMLSSFYSGRVHYNAQDYPRALYLFTEALDLATSLDDPFWKARTCDEIASVYNITTHYNDALHFSKQALENSILSGRQPHLNYSYLDYAISCLSTADSANIVIAEKTAYALLDSAAAYHDAALEQSVHALLVNLYYWQKDWAKVISHGKRALQHTTCNNDVSGRIGMAYLALNHPEEASKLLPDTIDLNSMSQLALGYSLTRYKGDLPKAIMLLERLRNWEDSALHSALYINYSKSLSDYYEYERQINRLQIKQYKMTSHVITGIVGLLLIISICTGIVVYRKKSAELQKAFMLAENLQNILSTTKKELSIIQGKALTLFTSRFSEIDALCRNYVEHKYKLKAKRVIADSVTALINEFSENKAKITALKHILDDNLDGLFSSFSSDFPNLPERDSLMFLYYSLGFSSTAISLFLKIEKIEILYNHKSRLKAKIVSSSSTRKQDYLNALS